jgi:WD40 repeat protein
MSPQGWKAYRDFVIKIEPNQEGGYRVEAQGPSGEGESTFLLPFDEKDLIIFLLEVSQTRKINIRGAIPQPAKPTVEFGKKLFNAVFNDTVRDTYISARTEAERKGYGLRLRLRLADAPELADLPWEYLHDGRDFLALSGNSPLVRYLDLPSPPRPLAVRLPLRILVTISDPHFYPVLDVDKEKANIKSALKGMIEDQKVELVFTSDASLKTLQRTLQKARSEGKPFHIWHFIGHGGFDPVSQTGQLALCDAESLPSLVDGFQLGTLFNTYPETRLVLLNACEGARNSQKDPFAGVAASLVERGIPAVVGMQFEITDTAAITFSEEFYSALVNGLPVDAALTEARRAVFFMPNWIEWATPVLFMRSPDGILFIIQAPSLRRKSETERLADQNIEQDQLEKERSEAERPAKELAGIEKIAAQKAEENRQEQEKAEAERLAVQKAEQELLDRKKTEAERLVLRQAEPERLAAPKVEEVFLDNETTPKYKKVPIRTYILVISAFILLSLLIYVLPMINPPGASPISTKTHEAPAVIAGSKATPPLLTAGGGSLSPMLTLPGSDSIRSVAFSPDGQTLAVGLEKGEVKLWNVNDGSLLSSLTPGPGVGSLAFSPDSQTLATGLSNTTVKLWRVSDGTRLGTLEGLPSYVYSVAFSPDGQTVAAGSFNTGVKVWRVGDGMLLHNLEGHTYHVYGMAFSPDGKTLATASSDHRVKLWRLSDGVLLHDLEGDGFTSVAFSLDGKTIAGSGYTVKLWRVSDGVLLHNLTGHTSEVQSVAFSPDGQTLLSGSNDIEVRRWRISDGMRLYTLEENGEGVNFLAFSTDGSMMATINKDGTVKLWKVQ